VAGAALFGVGVEALFDSPEVALPHVGALPKGLG